MGGLLGRTAEITMLNDAVSRLRLGHGQVCWVGGEPGIGKSALLDDVLTDLGGSGVDVLRASAGPDISDPYAALGGADKVLEAAEKGPVAVAIEDLQYANPTLSVIWHRLAAA